MTDDFSFLKAMVYSGRGIVVGTTPSGIHFVGYTLTGRQPSSQARELLQGENTGVIRTSMIEDDKRLYSMFHLDSSGQLSDLKRDLAKGSPALIYYPAIMPVGQNGVVVSNGAQTELLYSMATNRPDTRVKEIIEGIFKVDRWRYDSQKDRMINLTSYEPDSPNNTPRISACLRGDEAAIHIVWSNSGRRENQRVIPLTLNPGEAKTITTYLGKNEDPLRPFQGEPLKAIITSENARDIAESLYDSIHGSEGEGKNYRVACAVAMLKPGGLETAIINRVERGS